MIRNFTGKEGTEEFRNCYGLYRLNSTSKFYKSQEMLSCIILDITKCPKMSQSLSIIEGKLSNF